jgi:hypothetical protein
MIGTNKLTPCKQDALNVHSFKLKNNMFPVEYFSLKILIY